MSRTTKMLLASAKISSIVLALILLTALCCAGCSSGDDDDSAGNPNDDDQIDDDLDDDVSDDDADDDAIDDDADDDLDDDASDDDIDDDSSPALTPPILDEEGRTLILHGANFMGVQYEGGAPVDYQRMSRWGFNAVRILMTWSALEPTRGVYDENYLPDQVEPQVQYAADAGLRVILDMHQFHWSSCCGGMGWPDWTCGTPPDWLPDSLDYLWQSGNFWNNADDVDAFVAAWLYVAQYFAGDDRVFAYDLFNEPLAGVRTVPWWSENQLLRPLYVELIDDIRAIDDQPYLMLEPMMLSVIGFPFVMDPIDRERLIYGPHVYPRNIVAGDGYNFPPEVLERQVNERVDESIEKGMSLLFGETGLQSAAYHATEYARDFADLADAGLSSWTWWAFGYDDDSMGLCYANGEPKVEFYPHLARPYPRIIAGKLTGFIYDETASTLTISFDTIQGMAPSLEIFADNEYFYPNGFEVESDDADGTWTYTFDDEANSLIVSADPLTKEHIVRVSPSSR